jgi:hypothetical protein
VFFHSVKPVGAIDFGAKWGLSAGSAGKLGSWELGSWALLCEYLSDNTVSTAAVSIVSEVMYTWMDGSSFFI